MPNPIVLTREQVRRVDAIAIERFGLSGLVLMENAGRGCVDVLEQLGILGRVVILCGHGNNAGDGFVIARHLAVRGFEPFCILCEGNEHMRGDAATNFEILSRLQLPWLELTDESQLLEEFASADWIVDALLGTGAMGTPRAPLDRVIQLANAVTCRKLAVDIPSGLDCNSGEPSAYTFRADHTCTFVAAKPGLLKPTAAEYVGALHVVDIGVPYNAVKVT